MRRDYQHIDEEFCKDIERQKEEQAYADLMCYQERKGETKMIEKRYCEYCEEIVEVDNLIEICPECGCYTEPLYTCENCGKKFYDGDLYTVCPECAESLISEKNVTAYAKDDTTDKEKLDSIRDCSPFLLWANSQYLEDILRREFEKMPADEQIGLMRDYIYGNENDFAQFAAYIENKEKELSK